MLSHQVILLKVNLAIYQQEEYKMAQHDQNKTIDGAVELLKTNGFDGMADAVTLTATKTSQ